MDSVEDYVNAHELQYRDASDVVEEFSCEMAEMRGRCIDIGCGPGNVTKDLILRKLPPDAEIVGADISQSMVDFANRRYADDERMSFVQLDIETPDLPEEEIEQYDNALSFYSLHWCQNTRQAFKNIYKLLRPGGTALVMFLARNDGFDAYVRIHENPRYQPYMQDAHRYIPFFHRCQDSRATLRRILEDTGFDILHCSRREKSFIYPNIQILRNHALAVNPFLPKIPADLRKEFEDVMMREIVSNKILFPSKNGNGQQEYSVLDRYDLLIAHIKKPIT